MLNKFSSFIILSTLFLNLHIKANATIDTMASDSNHKQMEESLNAYQDVDAIKTLSRETVIKGFICPKLRLTKDDIINFVKNDYKAKDVEGKWTIGDFEIINGKEYLAVFLVEEAQDLLLDTVAWNNSTSSFDFKFRRPGENQKNKSVTIRLTKLRIKDPSSPIAVYLKNLAEHPIQEVIAVQPPKRKVQKVTVAPLVPPIASAVPQPYVPQQSVIVERPVSPPSTIVVENPFPAPVIVERVPPPVYIGPPIIGFGFRHGGGWHHRW